MFKITSFCLTLILALPFVDTLGGNSSPKILASSLTFDDSAIALPKPTGPHAVGTIVYNWTDTSRDDIVSENAQDKRQLIVQIWYPADPSKDTARAPAPYMPEMRVLRTAFKQGADQLERIRTNSLLQASLPKTRARYPVIVFSHGMGTPRSWYTMLMEELASQGYVVAGIDHPYMGLVAINEKVIKPYAGWTEPPPGGLANKSDEERDKYWSTSNDQLSADQRFVLNQIAQLNRLDPDKRFTHRLDLTKVGLIGHSQGFISQTCGTDRRFKACLNLDGVPALAERKNGLTQPYMTMRDGDDSPRATTIYEHLKNIGYDVLIHGAGHNSYVDLPILAGYKYQIDGVRSHRIINEYMLAFFDTYLKDRKSPLLANASADFPEVGFTIYKAPGA